MTKEKGKIKIVRKDNPILRKKAEEISVSRIKSKEVQDIIKKMKKALLESELGIAIAANQIGAVKKIFLISENVLHPELLTEEKADKDKRKNEKVLAFINPKIIKKSRKKELKTEGCLSIKGVYGEVKRHEKITVEAYNEKGEKFTRGASGLLAHAIQHEMDHLNGILFVDKAEDIQKYEDEN